MALIEKLEYKALQKQLEVVSDLIRNYKADLYDIEHDDFHENEVIRNEEIRVMLVGTKCQNLEEAKVYFENLITDLKKEQHGIAMKMAKYSKWQPSK